MMYYDSKRNRILLRDGISLVDSFEYARMMIEGIDTSGFYVLTDEHSVKYDLIEKTKISSDIYDPHPTRYVNENDHLIDWILDVVESNHRYTGTVDQIDRIESELDFFQKNGHLSFVWKSYETILKFKEDGVIWGVGRGSSCASLLMYLLEITDIDPLKYSIPFSELSKEIVSSYE